MILSDMVYGLRQQLSDEQSVGWPIDTELLAYLDAAADYLSETLITYKDTTMLRRLDIQHSSGTLPDDFVRFVGNVPIFVLGNTFDVYADLPNDVYYWGRFARPSGFELAAALPYTRQQASLVINIARMYALNKNEYDISQDAALLAEIKNSIAGARSNA
ncbi:hypothetical protein FACS1894204_06180 [Synergistales bacterium]|nr:hypothetical protein FACS1894204_06180 [Synergistales bacterium]